MSFDRAAAARHWRISILSRGGLTVSEVDELEDHVEELEEVLGERLEPEEAFWVAAHRVGTPEALTREFALVHPNVGWELRAQWALIGLLAYWLFVPLARTIVLLLAGAMATVPSLGGAAAGLMLYAFPLGVGLTLLAAAVAVRRTASSPTRIDSAVRHLSAYSRSGLLLVSLAVVAWQAGLGIVSSMLLSRTHGALYVVGEAAPLQSGLWSALLPVITFAGPALALVLIVKIQHGLEAGRYAPA